MKVKPRIVNLLDGFEVRFYRWKQTTQTRSWFGYVGQENRGNRWVIPGDWIDEKRSLTEDSKAENREI